MTQEDTKLSLFLNKYRHHDMSLTERREQEFLQKILPEFLQELLGNPYGPRDAYLEFVKEWKALLKEAVADARESHYIKSYSRVYRRNLLLMRKAGKQYARVSYAGLSENSLANKIES